MQLPQPYLYTSERMVAIIDRPQMSAFEGIIADPIFGYHTIWAAEVPFIPARSSGGKGSSKGNGDAEDAPKLEPVMQRQMRFLYDLAQSRDNQATFEMRLVAQPQDHGPTRVSIVFLGKVFHPDEITSRQLALGLWDKFSALFPREAPFSYPLVPVISYDTTNDTTTPTQPHSFLHWFMPLPFEELTGPQSIVELRKYEDWPSIRDIGSVLHARDYIPHPFVAALDHSAMARLFETLARQQQVTVVAITLRPQRLTDLEVAILHEFSGWYKRAPEEEPEVVTQNRLIQQWRELHSDTIDSYKRSRAELGQKVYDELVREHRSLFLIRLQVVGNPIAQDDVIEALGSEVMANVGNVYPSRWARVEATTPDESYWARFNLQWLEFARWGISPILHQDRRIIRLRQFATVPEAAGAFRLPIAPGRDGLAGIDVRDEPFPLPGTPLTEFDARCIVGTLLDRGIATTLHFSLPSDLRADQLQIFGNSSAGREVVVQRILSANEPLPWILLRRGHTSGRPLAERLSARYIALDSPSPSGNLGFHPLLPPPGIAPLRFANALLRVLQAVCALDSSTTPPLRQALYAVYQPEVYQHAGRTDQPARHPIDFATLAERIDAQAQQATLPVEVTRALRTHCVPPLQDLALTTAHLQLEPIFDVHAPTRLPLEPTIIDIGWLGSDINNAMFYGCLLIWYSLALALAPTATAHGMLALEDTHILFASSKTDTASISLLASIIHDNTKAGVGTLLIDDRPDLLESTVINQAAATILTRSTHTSVQEYTAKLIGASASQQARMTLMKDDEAIVKLQGRAPVHIAL